MSATEPTTLPDTWSLDTHVDEITRDADKVAADLARSMRSLADDLIRNAERLEAAPQTATVNSCGVIQSMGTTIDAKALQLSTLRRLALSAKHAVDHYKSTLPTEG